ncbi:PCMD domain-containing protein, partial [Alistipes communis]
MKRLILFGALCLPAFLAGCIHNDLPYPVVTINIEAIEAEGLDGAAQINAAQQTVILPLLETTDIRNVHITSVTLTEGGQSSVAFPGTFDLRTPLYTTLSLYQEYGWSIAATQTIERYFRVKKQVGAAEIDPANRTATAYVSRSTDLQNVPVKELKLGPAGITTYSPEIEGTTSFETVRLVDVTAHGRTEQWRLRVVPTDVTVRITQCDAWARIAWLAADGLSDTEMGFVYRRKGDTEWLAVPDVEIEGGTFRAKLAGLDPETTYELKAFSDTDLSNMREFTTEAAPQLPNAGFETWSTDRSDILYPYAADTPLAEQFWGSGNPGSMTLKKLVTTNEKDPRPGSEGQYCAQLKSQYVAFLGVGKFAAGNLFSGHYAETKGTDGIVNFSQPFTSRPVALHGWVKYNRGKMDYIKGSPMGM